MMIKVKIKVVQKEIYREEAGIMIKRLNTV